MDKFQDENGPKKGPNGAAFDIMTGGPKAQH